MPEDIIKNLKKAVANGTAMKKAKVLENVVDNTGLDLGIGAGERASLPDRYLKIGAKSGWSAFTPPKDMEREAYLEQSTGDILKNSIVGFGKQAAAGVLKGVGSWDMKGMADMALGNTEQKYGNWLDDIGNKILTNAEEENPIFQNKESMWNTAYWGNQFKSLGLTAGIIAESLGEQALATFLAPGAGNEIALSTKARLIKNLGKQFAFGSFKGIQEAYTNALETQGNVYQKYKELGYDEATAQKKSAEAATLNFRAETGPLMVLNGLQYAGTFGAATKLSSAIHTPGLNSGFSGGVETLIDKVLPNITNKWAKKGVGALANMTSEGLEEAIQTGVSKYATNETLKTTGNGKESVDYFDDEMRDSMIGGFLGGGIFSGAAHLLKPLIKNTIAKKYDYLHDTFLNNSISRTAESLEAKQIAEDNYKKVLQDYNKDKSPTNVVKLQQAENLYKQSQVNTHLTNTLNSLHLDYLTGKTTAFESHTEQMQNILNAVKSNDIKELQKFGLVNEKGEEKFEGSFDMIKKDFESNIKDSHTVKSMLENNLINTTSDFESAWDVTKREFKNNKHLEDVTKFSNTLNEHYTNDNQFNQLSNESKNRFKLESELNALEELDRFKPLSDINKNRAEEVNKELEATEKYNANDKNIVSSINKSLYHKGNTAIAVSREEINDNNKELKDLRDVKKIQEKVQERKNKQIKEAKSKEELNNTKVQLEKKEELDNKTKEAIVAKEKELSAQEIAKELDTKEQEQKPIAETINNIQSDSIEGVKTTSDKLQGNADIFGTGLDRIETTANSIDNGFDEKSSREAEALLSPSTINESQYTPEVKENIKSGVGTLLGQMKDNSSFEDLTKEVINQKGKEWADKHFNLLKEGWKLNGKKEEDYSAIYNKLFTNPFSLLEEAGKQVFEEDKQEQQKQVTQSNNIEEQKILSKEIGTPKLDSNNQIVYQYNGVVTNNEKPKLATLFRLHESNTTINEDGTIKTEYEYTSDELNEGQYVDSKPLLNPDEFLEGTEMEVRVPTNFMDILVPQYNSDGTKVKGNPITFGQYVAMKNLTPDMQEYKDKIPMIVYRKGATNEEKGLAFVHDIGWYHPERFLQSEPEKMQQAIINTKNVRHNVLDNSNSASITITEKKTTSFDLFKTKNNGTKEKPNYDFIPFAEANPDAIFSVADSSDKLKDGDLFTNNGNIILRNTPFKPGYVYDIRRAGVKDGKKSWFAFEVAPRPINNDVKTTVAQALSVFLNRNNPNQNVKEQHNKIAKSIQNATGLDITQPNDLISYLRQFIMVYGSNDDFDNVQNNKDVDARINSKNNDTDKNPGYIVIQRGGSVYIGAKKVQQVISGQPTQTIYSNANKFNNVSVDILLKTLDKKFIPVVNKDGSKGNSISILDTMKNNYHLKSAKDNKPVVMIDKDGNVKQVAKDYREYTMNTFSTNIKSQNISKQGEKPVYVSTAVMISYDLTSKLNKSNETITPKEVVEQVINANIQTSTVDNTIAADYLTTGGIGTIISTDYLLKGIAGLFSNAGNLIDEIRNKYAKELADKNLVDIKNFIGTETYNKIISEIKGAINKSYTNKEEAQKIFEEILKMPTGMPQRVGLALESRLTTISEVAKQENVLDENLQNLIKEVSNKAKIDLGIDFDNVTDFDEMMSVATLTDEQRKQFNEINTRVANLNPQEDMQLNDFIFNQIIPIIDKNGSISDKEIYNNIKKVITDVLKPIQKYYTDEVKRLSDLLEAHPQLKDTNVPNIINAYKKESERITEIQSPRNLKAIFKSNKERVASNLGIKESKIDENKSDGNSEYDEQNQEEKEGWQIDSLSIDPNAKTSAALKRFYSSIPVLDKEGNPKKGVFGLPLYHSLEEVGTMAKAILADTPADFQTMLDKLSEKKQFTWIPQLVEKLKNSSNQTQKQFVSDMAMSSLRMKFSMIIFDKKTNSYKTKVWDANQGGVIDQVLYNWSNNFSVSELILKDSDDEGNLGLNKEKAKSLINRFNSWKGINTPELKSDISEIKAQLKLIKKEKGIIVAPNKTSNLFKELSTNLVRNGQKLQFNSNGTDYEITNKGDGKFEINFLNKNSATKEEVTDWLQQFGIVLSKDTINELFEKGLYHNYKQMDFSQLFDTGGLFKVLADSLSFAVEKEGDYFYNESGKEPIREGVIKSLAALEYKYNNTITPTGGYMNGKNFYAITQNKFATERANNLKEVDSKIREQLSKLSFSKNSLYLRLLEDEKFRTNFELSHVAFNAMQILGKNLNKDNAINKLSSLDYEIASLGMFWDMNQGEVSMKYPGTDIPMRMATMLMPTMSDKQTGLWLKTAVLNLTNKDLDSGKGISDDVKKALYEQVVKPEIERMISFSQRGSKTDIKSYDEGASLFMFIPKLNQIEYVEGLTLREAIANKDLASRLTIEKIEENKDLMNKIYSTINDTINSLKEEKKESWKTDGIIELDKDGNVSNVKYIDSNYFTNSGKFNGSVEDKVNMAILDTVVNQMIQLSNSFMLFAGDPALYYKKDGSTSNSDLTQIVKDSFVNVGKRLANQIAPGIKLAQSEDEQYIQLFINDRKTIGDKNFIQYTTEILDGKRMSDEDYDFVKDYLGKSKKELSADDIVKYKKISSSFPNSAGYFEIEGSDAQEYTTWQEHLSILEKLGRTPDVIQDITTDDIAEARKLFSSNKKKSDLTEREKALIGLVMQPIKPVYTGQIYDENQDVMRTMYIKSSSFPLIPQLTEGLEIDNVREAMEKLQSQKKMNVRASYQTANKVGAVKNAIDLWDSNGRAKLDNLATDKLSESSLVLNRKDFRIQQDVPFKSAKNKEDKVTMGTQLMKLLFGNDIINFDGFEYQGKTDWTGKDLHQEFSNLHIQLVELKKGQLLDELGLDSNGKPVDYEKSTKKIQKLLNSEGSDRGFPKQVLEGLVLQGEGEKTEFTLPLWSSINSNKFESLLNAIVVNRLSKIKFPGNSYVAGSPEGFQSKIKTDSEENISTETQSQIVYTNSWDGESLKASYKEDGKVKKVQVLVGSKFRDNEGNLVNLLDDEYSEVVNGIRRLKQDKFDDKLFNLTSFRIPTTGISSASQIEIVGFLPYTNADLMVLPANLTKQKGLDFDVDKENTYQYWHHLNSEGKFEVLDEKHRTELLSKVDKLEGQGSESGDALLDSIFGKDLPDYTNEEISEDEKLKKKNNEIQSKLIQNKIIEIYQSVLSNPNDKLQAKINSILNTDYSEKEALFIDGMKPQNNENWTPLSGEYQKQKMALGAGGKIGTGAYSMDVVFHSLAQQAKAMGKPMELTEIVGTGEDAVSIAKKWRFGLLGKGGIESTGILGNTNTIDNSRSTSDLLNETAQIAVDNEKLQIMGKVNLNDLTLDVHKVFNLLGIDKFDTKDKHSISFLFMSQPILKDYVLKLSNSKSNLSDFEAGKKEKIIAELLNSYDKDFGTREINNEYKNEVADLMNESNMVEAIKSLNPKEEFGKLQAGVLLRFLEMEKYGLAIRNIQTTLNVESKGLGKSFFDVINKQTKLNNLGNGTFISDNGNILGSISNVSNLIGDYKEKPSSQNQITELKNQGYYELNDYMVKPNTYVGAFNIVTTNVAYNAWKDFMPYDSEVLQTLFNEVIPLIENTSVQNDSKTIENKQNILGEFKKYLATFNAAGFVNKTDDINEERNRLYIDSEENTSLATYINDLMKINGNKIIDTFIKSNKLFNSFEFKLNKNGQPSLIKFNNTKGESFDEQYLYEALSGLMEIRGKNGVLTLPKIGNKQYTLDTLAQDIINYAMLGNAKQEAIQFTKYIPIQYMNTVGYSYMMRNIHNKLNGKASEAAIGSFMRALGITQKTDDTKHYVSEFTTQYIQHNPELVKYTIDSKEANTLLIKKGDNSFIYNSDDKPTFIKIYDQSVKSKKKFKLLKFNGETYNQIPILGVFGMDEYQFGNNIGKSIVNPEFNNIEDTKPLIKKTTTNLNSYNVESGSAKTILEAISKDDSNSFAKLAGTLLEFVGDTKVVLGNSIQRNGKPYYNFNGGWNPKTRIITLNPERVLSNPELLAQTILHEVVHELTYNKVNPFIEVGKDNYVSVLPNAPKYVQEIVSLFNNVKSGVNKEKLDAFIANMNNVTNEEKSMYYGYTNVHEFMTMALTDKGFQEILNKIEYRQTGKSLLDKFKEVVKSILESVGINFDENYTAAHAINSIFGVIKAGTEKTTENPYQNLKDESDNLKDGEEEGQLSIMTSEYPDIKFDIGNTEC